MAPDRNETILSAREIRKALLAATTGVEDAAQSPVGAGTWRDEMLVALGDLRGAFRHHLNSADADGGIIEAVVEDAPRLSGPAAMLQAEHPVIQGQIETLIEAVESAHVPTTHAEAEAIRELVLQLLVALSRHRQHGSDLVWQAYAVDIGGQSGI